MVEKFGKLERGQTMKKGFNFILLVEASLQNWSRESNMARFVGWKENSGFGGSLQGRRTEVL